MPEESPPTSRRTARGGWSTCGGPDTPGPFPEPPAVSRLDRVAVPTLVVMGECDPNFADSETEARWVVEQVGMDRAELLLVLEAGHYPHAQRPDIVGPAVVAWLQKLTARG